MLGEHAGFLPDFIEPDDVTDDSLLASQYWGSESPVPPLESAHGAADIDSVRTADGRTQNGSTNKSRFGDGSRNSFGSGSRGKRTAGAKKPKKYLTWEEKQKRKDKRAAARAEQDERERDQDPFAHAREIALSYLASAPRTRSQLFERLSERSVEESVAHAVIDRLEAVGLVNDDEYARMLVRTRRASRGLARRGLAQELQRKGLGGEVAQNALDTVTADDELATARTLVEKKLRTMSRLDVDTQKRRLAGMLARKGYGPQIIWPVIRELVHAETEDGIDDSGLVL